MNNKKNYTKFHGTESVFVNCVTAVTHWQNRTISSAVTTLVTVLTSGLSRRWINIACRGTGGLVCRQPLSVHAIMRLWCRYTSGSNLEVRSRSNWRDIICWNWMTFAQCRWSFDYCRVKLFARIGSVPTSWYSAAIVRQQWAIGVGSWSMQWLSAEHLRQIHWFVAHRPFRTRLPGGDIHRDHSTPFNLSSLSFVVIFTHRLACIRLFCCFVRWMISWSMHWLLYRFIQFDAPQSGVKCARGGWGDIVWMSAANIFVWHW